MASLASNSGSVEHTKKVYFYDDDTANNWSIKGRYNAGPFLSQEQKNEALNDKKLIESAQQEISLITGIAFFTCVALQELLKAQAHFKKSKSNRGFMYNGLAELNIHFIPFFITPGAANGII